MQIAQYLLKHQRQEPTIYGVLRINQLCVAWSSTEDKPQPMPQLRSSDGNDYVHPSRLHIINNHETIIVKATHLLVEHFLIHLLQC